MSVNESKFPAWDGTSPTRDSRLIERGPDSEDWDQIVAEMLAQQAALLSGVEIKTGTFVGDGASPRTIATGLTKPIRYLFICADFGGGDGRQVIWGHRTDTMPGRDVAIASASLSNMSMTAGAGFSGSDFDVRADDIAFNDASAVGVHWIAVGF